MEIRQKDRIDIELNISPDLEIGQDLSKLENDLRVDINYIGGLIGNYFGRDNEDFNSADMNIKIIQDDEPLINLKLYISRSELFIILPDNKEIIVNDITDIQDLIIFIISMNSDLYISEINNYSSINYLYQGINLIS